MIKTSELFQAAEECRDELVAFHRDLVKIPTVNTGIMPTGGETEACKFIQRKLAAEGIESETHESAPSRGNLIARIGEGTTPSLMLMSHTDVVPVEDEKSWKYPPFSGELAEGLVWGRGSNDCKAETSTQVMTMIILKRLGVKLKGTLTVVASADEEAGGKYGFGYLAREHADKIRADFVLNEGGGHVIRTKKGIAYAFSVGEKGRLEAKFTLKGKSCHAATPWLGDNVLYKAQQLLKRIQDYEPDIVLTNPIFKHLDTLYGIKARPSKRNIERIISTAAKESKSQGVGLRAASRMTLTPTMIQAGIKSNSVPETSVLTCDIRTVPGQDEKYVHKQIHSILKGIRGVEYNLDYTALSNASPFNTEFAKKVMTATRQATGMEDLKFIPTYTNGFTDSRFVRPLGSIVYGFSPQDPHAKERESGAHGKDEAVEVETLNVMIRTYLGLCADLLQYS
jgi:acetylornithine deacetylase/succinyl-diaminopimelate desuccinylase-like protein